MSSCSKIKILVGIGAANTSKLRTLELVIFVGSSVVLMIDRLDKAGWI